MTSASDALAIAVDQPTPIADGKHVRQPVDLDQQAGDAADPAVADVVRQSLQAMRQA